VSESPPRRPRAEVGYNHPGSELTDDEVEFGRAMHEYQCRYAVRYPAWSEILFVLRALGYRKATQTPQELAADQRGSQADSSKS
jgi:hypothetical protein